MEARPVATAWVIGIIFFLLLITALWMHHAQPQDEVRLTLVVVTALMATLALLALIASAFSALQLSDAREALGLPSGSIRAVLAVGLLIAFVLLSVTMYLGGSATDVSEVPKDDLAKFIETMKSRVASVRPKPDTANMYLVDVVRPEDKAGADLAKTVLTSLGTLVSAVVAFYFGTQTARDMRSKSSSDEAPEGPVVINIRPSPIPAADTKTTTWTLSGNNLDKVKEIRLEKGGVKKKCKIASAPAPSKSSVPIQLAEAAPLDNGDWTIVITDTAGNETTASIKLNVT